jgi:hypothetical protein
MLGKKHHRRRKTARSLRFESLEDRRLMCWSGTPDIVPVISFPDGTLPVVEQSATRHRIPSQSATTTSQRGTVTQA